LTIVTPLTTVEFGAVVGAAVADVVGATVGDGVGAAEGETDGCGAALVNVGVAVTVARFV